MKRILIKDKGSVRAARPPGFAARAAKPPRFSTGFSTDA
jgi:hypothetical protein